MDRARRSELIDRYMDLRRAQPELFVRPAHFGYQLETSPAVMLAFAETHQVALGLLSSTPYTYLLVDLVHRHPDPLDVGPFPYQRLVMRHQMNGARGIIVVPVNDAADLGVRGAIFLSSQDRHATGRPHLEIVRGVGELGRSAAENATRELGEELGLFASGLTSLGELHIDPGQTDAVADIVLARISGRLASRALEPREAIVAPMLMTTAAIKRRIASGEITDSITTAALCRYFLWLEHPPVEESM